MWRKEPPPTGNAKQNTPGEYEKMETKKIANGLYDPAIPLVDENTPGTRIERVHMYPGWFITALLERTAGGHGNNLDGSIADRILIKKVVAYIHNEYYQP